MRLAIPWWEDALRDSIEESAAAPRVPAMQWLAARAAGSRPIAAWRDWLLEAAGRGEPLAERLPAGPCVRALTQDGVPRGVWAVAQPVHLATAIDHLRLAPPHRLAITMDEARALHATVDGHLAGTGFRLEVGAADLWSLHCAEPIDCETFEPGRVVGRNIRDFMPAGAHGAAVRSLMNEIQMLLHEHTVNERRARSGQAPVNSLWLWGFGALTSPRTFALPTLATDDAWLSGMWRLQGQQTMAVEAVDLPRATVGRDMLVALTRPPGRTPTSSLEHVDGTTLDALRGDVAQGRIRSVEIFTGSRVVALDARSRWRFWRRPAPAAREPA